MLHEDLEKYNGKAVLASFYCSSQRGVVYDGIFYGISVSFKEFTANSEQNENLILKLFERKSEELLGVDVIGNGRLSLVERGVLSALERDLSAAEIIVPMKIITDK